MMRFPVVLFLLSVPLHAMANDALWKRLQTEPNLVVVIRHEKPGTGNPQTWDPSGQCQGERMLTDAGRAAARRLGEQFRQRQITPIVLSSPMCRTRDTAILAFGTAETDPDLREIGSADQKQKKIFLAKAKQLLLKHRGDKPVVLVSHLPNIDALTFEIIAPGEMLIGKIGNDGEVEVAGRIKPLQ